MISQKNIVTIFFLWLFAAYFAGASGLVAKLHPPAPQLLIIFLTLFLIIAGLKNRTFREAVLGIDWRIIVAFHLVRFIGFYFLSLYFRNELPYEFAVIGGFGDILVAFLATELLIFNKRIGKKTLLVWNLVGLADIVYVVFTAARLALLNPQSMAPLLALPLSMLPTFVVPIIISSHILLLSRLYNKRAQSKLPLNF